MNEHIAKELAEISQRLLSLATQLTTASSKVALTRKPKDKLNCTNCGKPIAEGHRPVRGAHYKCYRRLIRLVREGLITEDEVVASGKLLPPEPGGRLPSTAKLDLVATLKEEARQAAEKAEETLRPKAKPE